MTRSTRLIAAFFFWAFALYLFLPLMVMIAMSFKDSNFIGFPIRSWTAGWYAEAWRDGDFIGATGYSMVIAVVSTAISMVMGTWLAVLLTERKFWGRGIVFLFTMLPAVVPGIISAISFRIYIRILDMEPGMAAIIFGHAVHNVPFVALVVASRLRTMPKSHVEAAQDLGADPFVAFMRVTLPFLQPALIGGGIFCMLLSFDDFIRSFFLGGYDPTLPVLLFSKLRSGMSPEISAIATVVLLVTAMLGLWAERRMRRLERG
ncbi:ABC transporter permease [Rhodobacteraceae bacterium CCMM004]|nr:ABC transporter permease [Rhodobacteraceae bacterium CCMM004]